MRKTRWIAMLLVLALLLSAALPALAEASADLSALPTIKYYFVAYNANPEDVQLVQDALNEAIALKIGANVELNPLSFAEITTKLPLMLTTGDDLDVLSVSQFAPYVTSYLTGGLMAIDDLLKNETPELWAKYDEGIWDSERIKGQIYMVPCYFPGVNYPGMWISKDFTDKYNFDWENCTKWEDYEPLFDAILEGEQGVTPMLSTDEYWGRLWFADYYGFKGIGNVQSPKGQSLVCIDAVGGKTDAFAAPFTAEYEESVRLMRKWYEKGYVLKTPPTETEMFDLRATGKMAAFVHAMASTWDTTGMAQAEWGGTTILQCIMKDKISITGATGNGNAVAAASKHPEAAIKFISEMHTNEYVHNLLNWGIEGKHWRWVDQERKLIDYAEGKTVDNVGYYPNATWQFGDKFLQYYRSEGEITQQALTNEYLEKASVLSPVMGFNADTEPVKAKMANVANVAAEYGDPLEKGLVDPDDPTRGLDVFRQKLKEAGIDDIVAELQSQIDAWKAENGK